MRFNGMEALSCGFCLLMAGSWGFSLGYVVGYDAGNTNGKKSTTIECVTKPQICKVRYEYDQLEKQK